MNKVITLGPYEQMEDKGEKFWASTTADEGAVRVIDGVLCYCKPYKIIYGEAKYSMAFQRDIAYKEVTRWYPMLGWNNNE